MGVFESELSPAPAALNLMGALAPRGVVMATIVPIEIVIAHRDSGIGAACSDDTDA